MKQRHINRLNAASVTVSFCEDTASETAAITRFAPLVATIKSEILIVQRYNQLSSAPTKGITENVISVRERMMQHTYELGAAVFSYGAGLSPMDYDVMAQAKLTVDFLERLPKEKCVEHCDRVCKLAASHAANIAPYGISAADISAAQTLVALYMNEISHPRGAIVTRSSAVRQAYAHLKHIVNTLLKIQLDSMADTLRFRKDVWWRRYYMSRNIIDLGVRHTKFFVYVNDANGVPVKGATAILLQDGKAVYTRKAKPDGHPSLLRMKAGYYTLRVEKKGWVSYTEEGVYIMPGKEQSRTVVMVQG